MPVLILFNGCITCHCPGILCLFLKGAETIWLSLSLLNLNIPFPPFALSSYWFREPHSENNSGLAGKRPLALGALSSYLRECWIQESSTGGGAGVNVVAVLISPMTTRASLRAWYIRSISSRRWACSADSSIRVFWSSEEYNCARSSEFMKSLT